MATLERKHEPVIQSPHTFRKACRITQKINPYTGKIKKVYNLIYGFRGNALYITAKSLKDAFNQYRQKFEYYDHFIETGSFLLQ